MSGINKVFKFGGASVKDAAAVRNLADIVSSRVGENILLVVSAMGKTTRRYWPSTAVAMALPIPGLSSL